MEFPPVTYSDWRRRVEEELGEAGFDDSLVSRSECGLEIEPLYAADGPAKVLSSTSADRPEPDGRGRERRWSLCQLYDRLEPDELRRQLNDDLDGGADGAWVCLGRPEGSSDDAGVPAESGDGVDLETLEALGRAYADRDSGGLSILLDAGHDVLPISALWLELLDRRGSPPPAELSFGADPMAILAASSPASVAKVDRLYRDMASLAVRCDRELPGARAAVVSTLPYRAAGVDAVGELACLLATLVDYLRRLTATGMSVAAAAGQIGLRVTVGLEIFPAAAKLRATRRLWHHALSASGVEAIPTPYLHAVTGSGGPRVSGASMGESESGDPWTDVLRSTTQVFAAIVGGADCITSLPGRAATGATDGPGRRLARNTQLILAEESLLDRLIDPAGGSYFMEALTEELGCAAWAEFQQIERQGGLASALRNGWIADRLGAQGSGRRSPEAEG